MMKSAPAPFLPDCRRLAVLIFLTAPCLPAEAAPVISEVMTSNSGTSTDEDGDSPDWVELYNPDATPVNLEGWYLTDNAARPTKWAFPSGVILGPGQFLVVWASGKNRTANPAHLHTNFSISANGEYLALISPDLTLKPSVFSPTLPPLEPDEVYGLTFSTTRLLGSGTPSQILVPADGALSTTWTQPDFTPGDGWTTGPLHAGFGIPTPGFFIEERLSKNTVTSIATAESVLAGTNAQDLLTAVVPFVNFSGDTGTDGRFDDGVAPLHGGDQSNFVIRASATIVIPTAGQWTFHVNSDEGFRLRINGAIVTSEAGLRVASDTLVSRTLTAGNQTVVLTYFENLGADELELSAAKGTHTSFSSFFKLIGDTAHGGLAALTPAGSGQSLVTTDLASRMLPVNPSVYVRVPFTLADPAAPGSLNLTMRYNDGFIAWLNGSEVGRRNAPELPAWNATATAARAVLPSLEPEILNLTASRSLLRAGDNLLTFQGLNAAANDPSFLLAPELGLSQPDPGGPRFFRKATPGTANPSTGYLGHAGDTSFSHKRGFYTAPFSLAITTSSPGTSIRYTTDGSFPTPANSTVYTAPVLISKTTVVRAMAFREGYESSNVDTQTYLFLDDVILQGGPSSPYHTRPGPTWPIHGSVAGQVIDYGMDRTIINSTNANIGGAAKVKEALAAIPSMCITTDVRNLFDATTGIYTHPGSHGSSWERAGALEMLGDPNTPERGFHSTCGLRIRGGFSRSTDNPKHSFRIFFRSEYGPSKLDYPIFGAAGAHEFDAFDIQCSQNYSWSFGGDAAYNALREIWSRDAQLDLGWQSTRGRYVHLYLNGVYWGLYQIQERAEAAFGSTYIGGNKDDYDVIKHTGSPGGYTTEATDGYFVSLPDGSPSAWKQLWTASRAAYWINNNKNPASPGVTLNSSPQDKLSSFYGLMGLQADGRTPTGKAALLDVDNLIDYIMIVFFAKNADPPLTGGGSNPNNFYCMRDRMGPFGFISVEHDAEHSLDAGGASDRWGPFESPTTGNWNNINYSNPQYLHQDLAASAEYRQRFGDRLYRACFNNGPLTLAKNHARFDRRASQIETAVYAESARWGDAKTTPALGAGSWRAARTGTRSFFNTRTTQFITEARSRGFYPSIEPPSFNQRGGAVPPGFNVVLANPNTPNSQIFYTLDGSDPRPIGGGLINTVIIPETTTVSWLVPSGANGGSRLSIPAWTGILPPLREATWETGPMGFGFNPAGRTAATNFTPFIRTGLASAMQSTPGAELGSLYVRMPFTLTQEQIQSFLTFRLRVRYDDGLVVYLNGQEVARKIFPAGSIPAWNSPAGGSHADALAIVAEEIPIASFKTLLREGPNVLAFHTINQSPVNTDFLFSAYVETDLAGPGFGQRYAGPIPIPAGTTIRTRVLNGNVWSALNEATFYTGTVPASAENLVVSEFSYQPDGARSAMESAWSSSDFEFIELLNISSNNVDLFNVTLANAASLVLGTVPQQVVLPPGGRVIVASNPAAFTQRYPGNARVLGPFVGSLDNGGESIRLSAADGTAIKEFTYSSSDPWPEGAAGEGFTLVLINPAANPNHNQAPNWRSSTTLNGQPGQPKGTTAYADWKTAWPESAEDFDTDGDGLLPLAEYALATSPIVPSPAALPKAEIRELAVGQLRAPYLTLSFIRNLAADDIKYDIESAPDPAAPWSAGAGVLVSESNNGDGTATMIYRSPTPVTAGQRLFLRLKLTLR